MTSLCSSVMRFASMVLMLALATPSMAQRPGAQAPKEPDRWDAAQTARYYLRAADEVRARKAFDAAHVALHTQAYKDLVHNFDASHLPRLYATWGEFVTTTGAVFIAVQLAPSTTPIKPDARLEVFGEVVDPSGKVLTDLEEPAKLAESKSDRFLTRTLFLPATRATATFGLGIHGEAVEVIRLNLDREDLTQTSAGVSRLIVSNNVFNLDHLQSPFEPFSFGGTRVVPKPDRTFHGTDEVWLFEEVRNPKVGDDGLPKLTAQIQIEGNGRRIMNNPTLDAQPLKGVYGHYGLGTALDLSALAAGEYRVTMTIRDLLAKTSYSREETIRLVN